MRCGAPAVDPVGEHRGAVWSRESGSGLVAGITLIFAFTFIGLVWLAGDVDSSISNRSAANSVAFQAARSGAQATEIRDLREGLAPVIDGAAARAAATTTAHRLLDGYGARGTVSVEVGTNHVTATVTITEAGRTVTGIATVEARRAP